MFVESNPIPVKWMIYKMNLVQNHIRLPLVELDETYHEKILSELYKFKINMMKKNFIIITIIYNIMFIYFWT